ncbi:MAG TPA: hypothetical protein VFC65_18635 [Prolixibacteraceae bacterium]|nr:hypothetical protein [Prolixibacteraceae bacterium]
MLQRTISLFFAFVLLFGLSLSAKEKSISPEKFKSTDIGSPALSGSTKILKDGISLTAGGADIWGTKDEFRFASFEQTGDFDMAARIESLTASNQYTKAGIMAREDLSDNSSHIFFQVFPDNSLRNNNNGGYEFQYRKEKNAKMKAIYPAQIDGTPEFPVNYPKTWIRLKRTGNEFTGYYSADGKIWKVYTSVSMKLSKKVYLGLAATSHDTNLTTTVVFQNISEIHEK